MRAMIVAVLVCFGSAALAVEWQVPCPDCRGKGSIVDDAKVARMIAAKLPVPTPPPKMDCPKCKSGKVPATEAEYRAWQLRLFITTTEESLAAAKMALATAQDRKDDKIIAECQTRVTELEAALAAAKGETLTYEQKLARAEARVKAAQDALEAARKELQELKQAGKKAQVQ